MALSLHRDPRPPAELVDARVQAGDSELLWLRSAPFDVAVQPDGSWTGLKLVSATGSVRVVQDGRTAELEDGLFCWLDAERPYRMSNAGGPMLVLTTPVDVLRQRHPNLDLTPAVRRGKDHQGERVVRQLMQALARERGEMEHAVVVLVEALGLCAPIPDIDVAAVRADRALRTVRERLPEARLSPDWIARQQGVTRRYLDGVVQGQLGTTLAGLIRRERMVTAARFLAAEPQTPVSAVGERVGFPDPSHFTRAFRAWHGTTPSDWRTSSSG